ncbi:hypothetical protein JOF56_003749 [Kibdelosporangium banguiense]|uniref:MuF-like minor capsid protein n=1 Tax=Kibdelosporangium banguiense TaxID=1365924 RepID=A0ABS4TH92_9PSEU|nr:hypothetical protein [Kibdelosporangium banguiense]MBP2323364.1 hypothetical protein [Kibdelosporangium banguiense]
MPEIAAAESYEQQVKIMAAAVQAAQDIWSGLDPTRLSESWVRDQVGDQIFLSVARSQELAAMAADVYTDLVLAEAGIAVDADGAIIPASLAGVASDGLPLDSLLLQPLITASVAQAGGATASESMAAGLAQLTRIVGTQVQDAGRSATGLSIAARPRTGWVRLVEAKACSRCVILAGRWYRWSDGFDRHPMCKCRNIPAAEDTPGLTAQTDPKTHFNSLTEAEQNRQFTKAGAQAIRDGADIAQVVNARRGAMGLSAPGRLTAEEQKILRGGAERGRIVRTDVYGQPVYITSEGTTKRGLAGARLIKASGSTQSREQSNGQPIWRTRAATPRLMPESIYQIAEDREDAIRLLKRFGYIT